MYFIFWQMKESEIADKKKIIVMGTLRFTPSED